MQEIHKQSGLKSGFVSVTGFPQLYHYELIKNCFALIMERLGPSLKDIREQISKRFSLKSVI